MIHEISAACVALQHCVDLCCWPMQVPVFDTAAAKGPRGDFQLKSREVAIVLLVAKAASSGLRP
jgi:hypothetical protein